MSQLIIEAAVEQTLEGLQVGEQHSYDHCAACGRELQAGVQVTAAAYKPLDSPYWQITHVYCTPCDHREIETPKDERREVLVSGCLALTHLAAHQTTRLVLTEVAIQTHSPPADACSP